MKNSCDVNNLSCDNIATQKNKNNKTTITKKQLWVWQIMLSIMIHFTINFF